MNTEAEVTRAVLMYFVLPLWLVAGFADYLCHRASHIATTSGAKESLIHLFMLAEIGVAVTAAMAFEINAAVILLMIAIWVAHEVTALWDVSFAHHKREVAPVEQWVHSYLGVLPLLSLVLVVVLHWSQFLALFGMGSEAPRFELIWKDPPLPWGYVLPIVSATLLFEVLPYVEELVRGLRARFRSHRIRPT
jgi:hypothetical protein